MEGVIETTLGFFLAGSIGTLFALFPESIIGVMMFLAGLQLTKFARDIKKQEIAIITVTVVLSLLTNMAIGFVSAMVTHHTLRRWKLVAKYIS